MRRNRFLKRNTGVHPTSLPACCPQKLITQQACTVVEHLLASEPTVVKLIGGGNDSQMETEKMKIVVSIAGQLDDGGRGALCVGIR